MKRKKGWLPVFLLPAVALFLLIYAVPLVIVFVSSLFDYRLTGDSMTFIGLRELYTAVQRCDLPAGVRPHGRLDSDPLYYSCLHRRYPGCNCTKSRAAGNLSVRHT